MLRFIKFPAPEHDYEQLIAADKVALIISNCMYQHLPKLVTPHCDAETLATALQVRRPLHWYFCVLRFRFLQDLKYKTVTLADLTLAEMKFVIKEYKKLLGNGVYGTDQQYSPIVLTIRNFLHILVFSCFLLRGPWFWSKWAVLPFASGSAFGGTQARTLFVNGLCITRVKWSQPRS